MSKQEIETLAVKPRTEVTQLLKDGTKKEYSILTKEGEVILDKNILDIETIISSTDGNGLSDLEKDNLYGEAQVLWNTLKNNLDNNYFKLLLNRKQFNYLTKLLLTSIEYDVSALFYALELTNVLGMMKKESDYKNDTDLIGYNFTATDITYLYHLLGQHKVKGLTESAYIFADIIRRICEISKIFEYYNNINKDLSKTITDWIGNMSTDETEKPVTSKKNTEKA